MYNGRKIILPTHKPDFVPMLSFICDIHYCIPVSAYPGWCLPKGEHQASSLHPILYMAFQHLRFTRAGNYLPAPWALTPHFHLYSFYTVVIFCGTISYLLCFDKLNMTNSRLFTGRLLCAVRTFLPLS